MVVEAVHNASESKGKTLLSPRYSRIIMLSHGYTTHTKRSDYSNLGLNGCHMVVSCYRRGEGDTGGACGGRVPSVGSLLPLACVTPKWVPYMLTT
jgi:hypothetical protein